MPTVTEIFETMEYGPAPESSSAAMEWIQHRSPFGLYVGGKWIPAGEREQFETINPAANRVLAHISQAGNSDVDAAVAAARTAQPGWLALGGHARSRYLYAMARQI